MAVMSEQRRILKLQVNTSGAWRNVLDFDANLEGDILTLAERLFSHEANLTHGNLRVIVPGDTAPLMYWMPAHGWKRWKDR